MDSKSCIKVIVRATLVCELDLRLPSRYLTFACDCFWLLSSQPPKLGMTQNNPDAILIVNAMTVVLKKNANMH